MEHSMKNMTTFLMTGLLGLGALAADLDANAMKAKYSLTGVYISSSQGVIAVSQKANQNLQFIEITQGANGQPEQVKAITSEFPAAELTMVGQKTKAIMMNPEYRRPRMLPAYNLTDKAITAFVSGGPIGMGAAVTFGSIFFIVDTVTTPVQFVVWAKKNYDFNVQNEALVEKAKVSSNSIIYLESADYNQVKWALSQAQAVK
jgi:hypothetical protein